MDEMVITRMKVGPSDHTGMLVSLSIGNPEVMVSPETISMTVRITSSLAASAEDIQAEALRRCAEVLREQLSKGPVLPPPCDKVVPISHHRRG